MVSKNLDEPSIRAIFQSYGTIEDCTILRDANGKSRGRVCCDRFLEGTFYFYLQAVHLSPFKNVNVRLMQLNPCINLKQWR